MIRALSWCGVLLLLWAALMGFRYPRSYHLIKASLALLGGVCFMIVALAE